MKRKKDVANPDEQEVIIIVVMRQLFSMQSGQL
jgi:hypothetical protein